MANSPSGDSMIDRLVRILDAFDSQSPTLTVTALSRRAEVPRATTYRLVDELVAKGLLARDPDGQIRLGLRLWELANRSAATIDLRRSALPFMEDVNQLVGQSILLALFHEDEVLVIERLTRPGAVINQANVAERMPVYLTSMGMALLAFSRPPVIDGYLQRHGPIIHTHHPNLRHELAEIRRTGFAALDGFIDGGTTGAAVPILDRQGFALAALSVVVPRGSDTLPAAAMALRTAARGISRALGH